MLFNHDQEQITAPDVPQLGQRFSQLYIQRAEPTQDSPRMRRRLASLVSEIKDLDDFGYVVPRELGVDVPIKSMRSDWRTFFRDCETQDLLDIITVAYRHLVLKRVTGLWDVNAPPRWCCEVQRIFQEENVHYRVDERGGVHFCFDAEFEINRAATIISLQNPRYRAALTSFEAGMAALAKSPSDGKAAIHDTFTAAEALFRLMFANSGCLTAQEAERLEPMVERAYSRNGVAMSAGGKVLGAFRGWIDAAQLYRQELGDQGPMLPPLTLAVQMVSLGACFVRWLAELDVCSKR